MSREYVVRQGDSIESIAFDYGLLWETIWEDPKNAELKDLRKNPNALLPGDIVHIKVNQEHNLPAATNKKHKFRRKGFQSEINIILLDGGKPREGVAYTLQIEGEEFAGKTDGSGLVKQKVRANARTGKLTLTGSGEVYTLQLRCLDPAAEPTGIQGRLVNLGYGPGPIDGRIGAQTQSALRRFQKDKGLKVTGDADQDTIDKLDELFGA